MVILLQRYKLSLKNAHKSYNFRTFAAQTVFETLVKARILILSIMYEQISKFTIYLMLYASVAVLNLIACCYLLLRQGNAFAADITSPVRLRRWVAALFASIFLSHLWYLPSNFLTSSDDAKLSFLLGGLLDTMTVFPLAIAILFVMLQDRRRPLWPCAVLVAPLVAGMAWCVANRSDALLPILYVYLILLCIGLTIYMVRAMRQYGRWLRDNYADLEHKELWQSFMVLGIILLMFGIYAMSGKALLYESLLQSNSIVLTCFLVWRVETLSDLNKRHSVPSAELTPPDNLRTSSPQDLTLLLQKYCIDTQLYLQHDLTLTQLAQTIGTNRFYLSQYFSTQGMTYNTYINDLRINHFVNHYREAVKTLRPFTAQQLAHESGYRSYSTFSLAFKQRMGQTVTAWMHDTAQ